MIEARFPQDGVGIVTESTSRSPSSHQRWDRERPRARCSREGSATRADASGSGNGQEMPADGAFPDGGSYP